MPITTRDFTLGIVAFVSLAVCAPAEPAKKSEPATDSLSSVSTGDLIARLAETSDEGVGTQSMALASGFMAVGQEPQFGGGVLGSRKPVTSAVMRELVRRGTNALPELLEHLSDARPTKLVVGGGIIDAMWHSDEYSPRDRAKPPSGVGTRKEGPRVRSRQYTLRVGDMCYVAVGQIVNRPLYATRYQPSGCMVINSPVETPALAAATRLDWSGFTSEEHEKSLLASGSSPSALVRLMYYFPKSGEARALKLLDRPFYDDDLVFALFLEKLVPLKDEQQWRGVIEGYRKAHGEANYRGLLHVLDWASNFPESQMSDARRKNKQVADKIRAQVIPALAPLTQDAATFDEQKNLLRAIAPFPSAGFDAAILAVFRRCVAFMPGSVSSRLYQGDLASECARRLRDGPYRDELLAFFEPWLTALTLDRAKKENESLFPALDQRIKTAGELITWLKTKGK